MIIYNIILVIIFVFFNSFKKLSFSFTYVGNVPSFRGTRSVPTHAQFPPDRFPFESIPTLFVHTKYFYTDKYEANFLCTQKIFIVIKLKLIFCAQKWFGWELIRVGIDRVRINRMELCAGGNCEYNSFSKLIPFF